MLDWSAVGIKGYRCVYTVRVCVCAALDSYQWPR